jgi:hypothetical protein
MEISSLFLSLRRHGRLLRLLLSHQFKILLLMRYVVLVLFFGLLYGGLGVFAFQFTWGFGEVGRSIKGRSLTAKTEAEEPRTPASVEAKFLIAATIAVMHDRLTAN